MQPYIVKRLRSIAATQLMNYRKNGSLFSPPEKAANIRSNTGRPPVRHTPEELSQIRRWRRVIDSVRARLREEDPIRERFMTRYFALTVPKNRRQTQRARQIQIMTELSVSDSTLYKWKREVLDLVVFAALSEGLLTMEGEL